MQRENSSGDIYYPSGIPIWVGRKLHARYSLSSTHRRNLAVVGGVTASVSDIGLCSIVVDWASEIAFAVHTSLYGAVFRYDRVIQNFGEFYYFNEKL